MFNCIRGGGSFYWGGIMLYHDTSPEELKTFETIELSVRKHLLETVAPEIGNFLAIQQGAIGQEESEK